MTQKFAKDFIDNFQSSFIKASKYFCVKSTSQQEKQLQKEVNNFYRLLNDIISFF